MINRKLISVCLVTLLGIGLAGCTKNDSSLEKENSSLKTENSNLSRKAKTNSSSIKKQNANHQINESTTNSGNTQDQSNNTQSNSTVNNYQPNYSSQGNSLNSDPEYQPSAIYGGRSRAEARESIENAYRVDPEFGGNNGYF